MKKLITPLSFALLCVLNSSAQKETKKFSAGFGLEAGAPAGNITNAYNFAVGLTVRFSYHVGAGFATLTTGTIGYAPKKVEGEPEKAGLQIPVMVGYKYIVQHHFFVMGETGYSAFKSYYGKQGALVSTSQGSFVLVPSLGVQFNAFEVALRYMANFGGGGGGLASVRIGFNF